MLNLQLPLLFRGPRRRPEVSGLRGAIAFALSLRVPCEGGAYIRGSEACRNSDLRLGS